MYCFLQEAGLTKDLDLRILRPFSGYNATPLEQVIKGLKEFPDAIMGEPVASQDKIPPVISESVLKPPQIPKHIFDEMNLIIGENGKGYLDTDKKKAIEWAWVENEPTCTVWYTSPTIFDWQPSDYLWLWFTAVKFFLGPGGTVVDEVLNGLVNAIGELSDKENNIYFAAKVSVQLNDKGILATDFIKKGEWLSKEAVSRKMAGFAFSAVEKQMLEDRSEGIDPAKFSMGMSYNGTKIPPIIIRAEVFGFEEVPADEYPRTIKAVRFYLLYPENIAHKGPYQGYDLQNAYTVNLSDIVNLYRKEQYLGEQNRFLANGTSPETIRKLAWDKLPDPLNSFEIVTDFSPKIQELAFRLTEETANAITTDDEVYAELWTGSSEKNVRYTGTVIEPGQQKFNMALYNKNNADAVTEYLRRVSPPNASTSTGRANPAQIEAYIQRMEARKGGMLNYNLVDIKSQYQIKLRINDNYASKTYHVNLDKGRGSQKKITGNRSYPKTGIVKLDYDPEIDIAVAKVQKGAVQPGKQHGDRDG